MPSNKEFGENMRRLRQSKSWSQENLAAMLNRSHSWVAKVERGELDVSLSNMRKIAESLGVNLEELLSCDNSII